MMTKNFIQYVEDIIKELGYAEDVKFFEYLSGEVISFDIGMNVGIWT